MYKLLIALFLTLFIFVGNVEAQRRIAPRIYYVYPAYVYPYPTYVYPSPTYVYPRIVFYYIP